MEVDKSGEERSPLLRGCEGAGPSQDAAGGSASSNTLFKEPADLYRSRWNSIRVMYLTMFISAVTFTITMSTIWPYLKVVDTDATPSLLGWVVAAYSLGQLVASPVFGLWSAKRSSAREPLSVSLLLQVGANLFYAYVPSLSGDRGLCLAAARCLMGFASGNAAVVRAYVSGATTLSERTSAMANVSIFQSLGFILGPVLQTALVSVGYPGPVEDTWLHLDMYTTPAILSGLLAVVNLLLLAFVFREHVARAPAYTSINDDSEQAKTEHSSAGGPPDYVAIGYTIVLFFVVFFVFTIFETIATPLGMDMYGWTKPQASLYMGIMLAVAGVLAIFVFVVVKLLAKRFDSRLLLIAGYIFCFVGFFIFLPWGNKLPVLAYAGVGTPLPPVDPTVVTVSGQDYSHLTLSAVHLNDSRMQQPANAGRSGDKFGGDAASFLQQLVTGPTTSDSSNVTVAPEGCPWTFAWCGRVPQVQLGQFIGGTIAIAVGYPICNVMTYTLFSKVLGPQPQGLWMGFLTATGSLARTLGPIFVSQIYDAYGPRVTFAAACGVLLCTVAICLAAYRRLLPFDDTPYRRRSASSRHVT